MSIFSKLFGRSEKKSAPSETRSSPRKVTRKGAKNQMAADRATTTRPKENKTSVTAGSKTSVKSAGKKRQPASE